MPFLVYKSSAGSGKTFTLVKEYLKIVLANPLAFRNVLALTFTNKATTEMKSRIVETLAELARGDQKSSSLLSILVNDNDLRLTANEIQERSARVLQLIIHNYSEFAVNTIDSFMHRVVRAFAFDLQLPVGFEVEIENDTMIDRAVSELLQKVGTDQQITDLLSGFVKTLVDDEKGWDIRKGLADIANSLFDEKEREGAEPLRNLSPARFLLIHAAIRAAAAAFENEIRSKATALLEFMKSSGIEQTDTSRSNASYYAYIARIVKNDFSKLEANSYVNEVLGGGKLEAAKCSPAIKQVLNNHSQRILSELQQIVSFSDEYRLQYHTLNAIAENFFPTATLSLLDQLLLKVARDNNQVHLSEFNRKIASIVLNEPVPFIYARLGERYKHFLVDEFQDTSVIQWRNLLPLAHNALASSALPGSATVLVVGDSKQSIYRWRNGETEQFQQLPSIFEKPDTPWFDDAEQTLKFHFQPHDLNTNFRSSKEIVEFNNTFFRHASNTLPGTFKPVYDNLDQKAAKGKGPGRVELRFVKKEGHTNRKEVHLQYITDAIRQYNAEGLSYSEMAVLCRGNDDCAQVAQHLLQLNIPVVSSESLLLATSPKVATLVNALRMLQQPQNLVYSESLSQLIQNEKQATPDEAASLINQLKSNEAKLLTIPIYDLAESIIRFLGFSTVYDPYIQFFLDAVQEFSQKDFRGLPGFLEWWDDQRHRRSVELPDGTQAVQVLTIHKSKGLAFGAVILPFIGNTIKPGRLYDWIYNIEVGDQLLPSARVKMTRKAANTAFSANYTLETDKSRLDALNLLYVAFTRAIKRLTILADEPPDNKENPGPAAIIKSALQAGWPSRASENPFIIGLPFQDLPSLQNTPTREPQAERSLQLSHDWRETIATVDMGATKPISAQTTKAINFGIRVHKMMSEIQTSHDILQTIERAKQLEQISDSEAISLTRQIEQVVQLDSCKKIFSGEGITKSETPLLLPNGKVIRPDRVWIGAKETLVADFKTGKPHDSHQEQIRNYMTVMKEMGLPNVKGVLVYLDTPPIAMSIEN
ncbi:MAG: UvrD-helicase domain-containing protein [Bacteroidales bacterium]|nr:UvrD-helicase domain-containing protein [Bacteroidales bacterium]